MVAEKRCQKLSDNLLNDAVQEGNDLAAHLASCPECRHLQENLAKLSLARPRFFPPPSPRAVQSIVDNVFPAPTPPWPLVILCLTAALGILIFSFLALTSDDSKQLSPQPKAPRPPHPGNLPIAVNPDSLSAPCRIVMPAGERLVTGPDGSRFELTGRVDLRILERGFSLREGMIVVHVKRGNSPFFGKTPHGTIEVTGTVFKVLVHADRTFVSVLEGKVRLHPLKGRARDLSIAESFEMSASSESPPTAPWVCPPSQESGQR